MYAPAPNLLGKWSLAVLPLLFLSACATTDSVSEQTAPLNERIAVLEANIEKGLNKAQASTNEAKYLAARHEARMAEQERRLLDQAQQLGAMREDISRLGKESAKAQSIGNEAKFLSARHEAQLADLENRYADQARQLAALRDEISRQGTVNTNTLAQTETRLKETDAGLSGRMDQLERRLADVARMAEEALAALGLGPRKIFGKVVHSVTLTDDKTLFPINSPELGDKDIAKLNAVAEYVKKLDVNYHIGIHGHTDGLGSDDYNYALGKARAEVVKGFLHEKRGIPLLRMSVISHGAVGVTGYKEGANRRIVVEVLQ